MSPDVETSIVNLREKVIEVETTVNTMRDKTAETETTVRIIKHDVANLQQTFIGFASKIEKMEDRLGGKIDELKTNLVAISLKQEKSGGFFAGIAFVIVGCGALLMAMGKLLFSPHN